MPRPRILVVTVWYPTVDDPTARTFVRAHVRAAAQRHDVDVLHLDEEAPAGTSPSSRIEDGINVHRFPIDRAIRLPGTARRGLAAVRAATEFDLAPPQLVHAHMVESFVPAALLARRWHRPWVATEHWSGFPLGEATRGQRLKLRWVGGQAAMVLPVSSALEASLLDVGLRAPTAVVPNPFDPAIFRPPGAARVPGPPRLLAVGRLHRIKGFDVLLDALSILGPAVDWRLDLIGEGSERRPLEDMAGTLGLRDRVSFAGGRTQADVAKAMRSADLLVAPSRYETQGAVLVEAAASGLPVVASDVGGVPEVVRTVEGGRLVAPNDAARLAAAIRSSLEEPCDRDALAARARDLWSLEAVGEVLADIYARVTAAERHR